MLDNGDVGVGSVSKYLFVSSVILEEYFPDVTICRPDTPVDLTPR